MLSFNKKALYQMAQKKGSEPEVADFVPAREVVLLRPLTQNVPDGRLASKLDPQGPTRSRRDKIQVSTPVRNPELAKKLAVSKTDVRSVVGYGTLGFLANAYVEQNQMTAEEVSMVQKSFYGLRGV